MAATAGSFTADADDGNQVQDAWREDVRRHALANLKRPPPRLPLTLRIFFLVLILFVHGIGVLVLSTPRRHRESLPDTPVVVYLLDESTPKPLQPSPQLKAQRKPAPALRFAPADTAQPHADVIQTAPPALQLFNPDGSIRLPTESPTKIAPSKVEMAAELMHRGHNIIHCRRTRFAEAYARDESMGDRISRKYLALVGLADLSGIEERAARRKKDAAEACDW